MNRDEAEAVARETAHAVLEEAFAHFGVDLKDADSLRQFHADLIHVRKSRLGAEQVAVFTRRALIGAGVTGLLTLLFIGIKHTVTGNDGLPPGGP